MNNANEVNAVNLQAEALLTGGLSIAARMAIKYQSEDWFVTIKSKQIIEIIETSIHELADSWNCNIAGIEHQIISHQSRDALSLSIGDRIMDEFRNENEFIYYLTSLFSFALCKDLDNSLHALLDKCLFESFGVTKNPSDLVSSVSHFLLSNMDNGN